MENKFCISLLALCMCHTASFGSPAAQTTEATQLSVSDLQHKGITIQDLSIARNDTDIFVAMQVDASKMDMKSNREILFTPAFVNGNDTLRLNSFTIAGRNRYFSHLRNDANNAAEVMRSGENTVVNYRADSRYNQWMERSTLILISSERGCCSEPLGDCVTPLAAIDYTPKIFAPTYLYISPEAEAVKTRELNASAYIDFPVNKTVIYPDYRRNPAELAKIRATIDSVRADSDITITTLHIKGYASPEGSYANNTRLAEGRTKALSAYVQTLYSFPKGLITTSFEPEDWEGLRRWVDTTSVSLPSRSAILEIIDSSMLPDAKDARIRSQYPRDYAMLLRDVYPALRHSDYTIDYTVRSYTSPEEIIKIMTTAPGKLSLQELYVAALSQEPGSNLYNEAFEIAVRMYPNDETANLNAAIAAMQRNDLRNAARYIDKAGDTDQARYARAILDALNGNTASAIAQLDKLPMPEAADAKSQLEAIENASQCGFKLLK